MRPVRSLMKFYTVVQEYCFVLDAQISALKPDPCWGLPPSVLPLRNQPPVFHMSAVSTRNGYGSL